MESVIRGEVVTVHGVEFDLRYREIIWTTKDKLKLLRGHRAYLRDWYSKLPECLRPKRLPGDPLPLPE